MQTGITVHELAAKLKANKGSKRDFLVNTTQLRMTDEDGTLALRLRDPEKRDFFNFPVQDHPHRQIADRLKIPQAYYERMRTTAPSLLVHDVNYWFKATEETRMVRTLGGNARAFLSDRYNRIDNEDIAEVAIPILMNIPDCKIISCEVTDRRMYIQAVTPRTQGEVKKGDIVQAGVIIGNSEIGSGALYVSEMDYRLECLNGMVSGKLMRQHHVGRQIEDNAALWAEDTRKADDRAILLKMRDMVSAAVDASRFRDRLGKMKGLAAAPIKGNPVKTVELLTQKLDLTEAEGGSILNALIKGTDLSAWGVLNAVTAQAHTAASYDRSVELEQAGGTLLDLPVGEWNRMLEAA